MLTITSDKILNINQTNNCFIRQLIIFINNKTKNNFSNNNTNEYYF